MAVLIDEYGRSLNYVRISVTDRCNFRCTYCMPADGVECIKHSDILRYEEIKRLCEAFWNLGVRKFRFTGGEPLVRRGIPDLVGKLKGIPGIDEVTLTTNGILLKEQIKEYKCECCNNSLWLN